MLIETQNFLISDIEITQILHDCRKIIKIVHLPTGEFVDLEFKGSHYKAIEKGLDLLELKLGKTNKSSS